jgi:hypothetical protein
MKTLTIQHTPETPLELLVEQAQRNKVVGNHAKLPPFTRNEARKILANLALQPDPDVRALFRGLYESLEIAN